jgi:hypothetical protein
MDLLCVSIHLKSLESKQACRKYFGYTLAATKIPSRRAQINASIKNHLSPSAMAHSRIAHSRTQDFENKG